MSIEEWQEEQGKLPDEPTPYTIPVPFAPDVPTTKAPDVPTINQRQYNLPQFDVPNVPDPNVPSSNAQYIMSQYNRWAQQPQYAIHQNLNTGQLAGTQQNQLWSNPNYNPDIHGSWGETEENAPGSIDLMQLSSSGLSYYGKGGWAGHLAPGIGEEQAAKLLSGDYSEGYPLSAWDFLNEWPGDDAGGGGYAGYGSGSEYGNWGGPSYSIASGSPRYSSWGLVMWRIT